MEYCAAYILHLLITSVDNIYGTFFKQKQIRPQITSVHNQFDPLVFCVVEDRKTHQLLTELYKYTRTVNRPVQCYYTYNQSNLNASDMLFI